MPLTKYRRKRNFLRTPEPAGRKQSSGERLLYVVQKHAASHLHYDFRLEFGGVLKSWAVPKGPSLDPAVKSLAVEVEDHPVEYGSFEGIIPQGQYGGGTVMLWDRGTWQPDEDPAKGYAKGKLSFTLNGEKLHGGWTLVRMHGKASGDRKNWLLIKRQDKSAKAADEYDILAKGSKSIVSNRDMSAIAGDAGAVWNAKETDNAKSRTGSRARVVAAKHSRAPKNGVKHRSKAADVGGVRAGRQPTTLKPQLATLVAQIPQGDDWLHEVKFDGYRILAFVRQGRVRLTTRNGNDWTARFRPIAKAVELLRLPDAILDGEVVLLNDDGISDFQRLQNWLKSGGEAPLSYFVFDLPYLNSKNLTDAALVDRKKLLEDLLPDSISATDAVVRYSDHVRGGGPHVIAEACRLGVEGVVSKRAESPYSQGRTRDWVKTKCIKHQEFVIGGYSRPGGARAGFGALLLGYYQDGGLKYCGRVGTGFTQASLRQLANELRQRRREEPAFDNPPIGAARRGVTWVDPQLVAEVEFTEWTDDGSLRHPSFQGLREDKPAEQVVRELPSRAPTTSHNKSNGRTMKTTATTSRRNSIQKTSTSRSSHGSTHSSEATIAGVRLTHPERIVFQEPGLTKRDIAEFYVSVADDILPHIVGRPLTLLRCPQGQGGECFFQKHLTDALPEGVRGVMIAEKSGRRQYVAIDDLHGLISLVQMGALEFHPWPASEETLERPDLMVFDLDPGPGVEWKQVIAAARELRARLDDLGLESFARTSGGKGLHVVLPLAHRNTWDELKGFAKALAEAMARESPARYVATMSKAKRQGKIFIDYLRNQRGATAIASYSTRARLNAPVATPLSWDELAPRLRPEKYTVATFAKRLAAIEADDPWKSFFKVRQSLTRAMLQKLGV